MYVKDEGIVCRRIPYSETSWILKIYTPNHGMISLIAKGARRQKSRLAGKTELFSCGEFQWYSSKNSELYTLTEVALKEFRSVEGDLLKLSFANVLVELLLKVHSDPRPDKSLYEIAKSGLGYLIRPEIKEVDPRFLARYYLKVLESEGHGIQLDNCGHCGLKYDKVNSFSFESGSFICENCTSEELDYKKTQTLFNFVKKRNFIDEIQNLYWVEKTLLSFMEYHFGKEINLKSYDLLNDLRR